MCPPWERHHCQPKVSGIQKTLSQAAWKPRFLSARPDLIIIDPSGQRAASLHFACSCSMRSFTRRSYCVTTSEQESAFLHFGFQVVGKAQNIWSPEPKSCGLAQLTLCSTDSDLEPTEASNKLSYLRLKRLCSFLIICNVWLASLRTFCAAWAIYKQTPSTPQALNNFKFQCSWFPESARLVRIIH